MRDDPKTVHQIRAFNRFYIVLLGFLNRNYLHSGYSVTETRILFELKENGRLSAARLIEMLQLDKSYISRILRGFEQNGIIARETDARDKRSMTIRLTPRGVSETDRLIEITNREIGKLIEPLDAADRGALCASMRNIIELLSAGQSYEEKKP